MIIQKSNAIGDPARAKHRHCSFAHKKRMSSVVQLISVVVRAGKYLGWYSSLCARLVLLSVPHFLHCMRHHWFPWPSRFTFVSMNTVWSLFEGMDGGCGGPV
jgi:hypothetical protein